MLAGGAVSAGSQIYAGKEQQKQNMAQAQAQVKEAENNRIRAGLAQLSGEKEIAKESKLLAQNLAGKMTAFAGNNILLANGGTVENALESQRKEGLGDIQTVKENTAMNVWGYQTAANANLENAKMLKRAGKAARIGSVLGATGTTLSAIGSAGAGYAAAGGSFGSGGGTGPVYSGYKAAAPVKI